MAQDSSSSSCSDKPSSETLRELFGKGQSFAEFIDSIPENKLRFQKGFAEFTPQAPQLEFFRSLGKLRVLVIGEYWCKDTQHALPIAAKLESLLSSLELRIIRRDENLDVVDRYFLTDGKRKIPVFLFLRDDYVELARWIERPRAVDKIMHEGAERLRELGHERFMELVRSETMREWSELLRRAVVA